MIPHNYVLQPLAGGVALQRALHFPRPPRLGPSISTLYMPGRLSIVAFSVILFGASCTSNTGLSDPALPGKTLSMSERYRFLDRKAGADDITQALERLPFSKIELKREACFGPCPVYTVSISRFDIEFVGV